MQRRSFLATLFAAPAAVKAAPVVAKVLAQTEYHTACEACWLVPCMCSHQRKNANARDRVFEPIVVIGGVIDARELIAQSPVCSTSLTIRFTECSHDLAPIALNGEKRSFKVVGGDGYTTFSAFVKAYSSLPFGQKMQHEASLELTGDPARYHPVKQIS